MKNIIFFIRYFSERGTETSIYNYAKYNEEILKNKSYIVSFTKKEQMRLNLDTTRISYNNFKSRFDVFEINNIEEITDLIDKYNIDFFYTLTYGDIDIYKFENKKIWKNCKTIKHSIFNTNKPESDFYISNSNFINKKNNTEYPVLPLIIDLPNINDNLKRELNIPNDAIVIGRHGGYDQFNIQYVYNCIYDILEKNDNIYFLFMNTKFFYNHPRIIYLEPSTDMIYKTKFINTCSAMIHARTMGETFGVSIGEFSLRNKPIITSNSGDKEHINILKEKAIIYNSSEELNFIFNNIESIINSRNNWNAYEDYSPEKIMKLFDELIFSNKNIEMKNKTNSNQIFEMGNKTTPTLNFDINSTEDVREVSPQIYNVTQNNNIKRNSIEENPKCIPLKHFSVHDDDSSWSNLVNTKSQITSSTNSQNNNNSMKNISENISEKQLLFPITFSIPEIKMISLNNTEIKKTKLLSSLIPGNTETYIYDTEKDYYNEYKKSLFAITCKKAGWDCMRHYEIIANGCIPYFPNIEKCPKNTMALFPKNLILEGNKLYEKIIKNENKNLLEEDKIKYNILIEKLMNYTRENLTCKKIAEYILQKSNHTNVKNILFLSGHLYPDYLRCLTLIGFKELFGQKCHDYPKVEHIYKSSTIKPDKLYGKGFSYSNIINDNLHDIEEDIKIIENIKNKKYDIVIYGSYMRGTPFYDIVKNIYSPDKIILLCGEDKLYPYEHWIDKGHYVFIRELE